MSYTDTISKAHNNNTLIPSEYKKTAIGIIPTDWEVKKLKDLCFNKGEYGINAAAVDFSEDLPVYLRITDIDDDGYFSSSKKCSVDDINSSNFYLNKNDIVFVRTGAATGKAYLYNERDGILVYAGFLIRFKIDINKANDYFLWSFTQSKPYWDWVKTVCTRSGQPGINSTEYASIQLPIPPLPEQQKIAEILATWDEAIANCKNTIKELKLRNKGLAQQLLTGKKRLRGFEEKWKMKALNDLFTPVKKINDGIGDHTIMTISAKSGFVKQEDKFDRIIAGDSLKKYTQLKKFDFAYNKGNSKTYPMGCIYQLLHYESALIPFVYICFEPKTTIDANFYKFWFLGKGLDNQLQKIITSGARGDGLLNVSSNDFFNLKVPFLEKKEQSAIAKVLETGDEELKNYEAKLQALQLQKKGLMQQLLTGKIRVNVK